MTPRKNENRFKIDLPKGWRDQTVYHFVGPEDSGLEHSVRMTIDRGPVPPDIAQFARRRTQPIKDSLQSVEVLKDEDITEADCNPCWEFVYKWIPSDSRVMIQTTVFVITDTMGFVFESRFTKKTYQTIGRQIHEVIEALLPGTFEPTEDA